MIYSLLGPWRRRHWKVPFEVEMELVAAAVRDHVELAHHGGDCECVHEYEIEGVTSWWYVDDVDGRPLGVTVTEAPHILGSFTIRKGGRDGR